MDFQGQCTKDVQNNGRRKNTPAIIVATRTPQEMLIHVQYVRRSNILVQLAVSIENGVNQMKVCLSQYRKPQAP